MDEIFKYVGAGAGYPPLVVGIILLWRLMLEYRRDRDFWRNKYFTMRDEVAEPLTKTVEHMVKTPPQDDEDKIAFSKILQSVLAKVEENAP